MQNRNHDGLKDTAFTRRAMMAGLAAGTSMLAFGASPVRAQAGKSIFDGAAGAPALGMNLTEEQRADGVAFLKRYPSVDVHAHPGRFFLRGLPQDAPAIRTFGQPFEKQAIADLNAGNVSAALFAAVADMQVLEVTAKGIHAARAFKPGEAIADYERQIGDLRALTAHDGLGHANDVAGIYAAKRKHKTAAIYSVEGGDFIEDKLDRVHRAYTDGVRAITIVHYRVNQIGDIQTEAPVHNGLTALGKAIVREMNKTGIIVDLAHATFDDTKDALEVSDKPVMISHTNLMTAENKHPRLITGKHADIVADHGGLIGAVPSGIGQTSFGDYIDSIMRLVDRVGVNHVAIGTDMDANYKPVFTSYRDWSLIPAALLAKGLHAQDVEKIMGGNFIRIFRAALDTKRKTGPESGVR